MPDILYADTSALVKLLIEEPETEAVRTAIERRDFVATSVITEVELGRAVLRARERGAPALDDLAVGTLIAGLVLVELTPTIRRAAAALKPTTIRSLDAIHLATAASLGADIEAVLTYDHRMQEATLALGLSVLSPG